MANAMQEHLLLLLFERIKIPEKNRKIKRGNNLQGETNRKQMVQSQRDSFNIDTHMIVRRENVYNWIKKKKKKFTRTNDDKILHSMKRKSENDFVAKIMQPATHMLPPRIKSHLISFQEII